MLENIIPSSDTANLVRSPDRPNPNQSDLNQVANRSSSRNSFEQALAQKTIKSDDNEIQTPPIENPTDEQDSASLDFEPIIVTQLASEEFTQELNPISEQTGVIHDPLAAAAIASASIENGNPATHKIVAADAATLDFEIDIPGSSVADQENPEISSADLSELKPNAIQVASSTDSILSREEGSAASNPAQPNPNPDATIIGTLPLESDSLVLNPKTSQTATASVASDASSKDLAPSIDAKPVAVNPKTSQTATASVASDASSKDLAPSIDAKPVTVNPKTSQTATASVASDASSKGVVPSIDAKPVTVNPTNEAENFLELDADQATPLEQDSSTSSSFGSEENSGTSQSPDWNVESAPKTDPALFGSAISELRPSVNGTSITDTGIPGSSFVDTTIRPTTQISGNQPFNVSTPGIGRAVLQQVSDTLVQEMSIQSSEVSKSLTLKLNPQELGQLTLHLVWENEAVKAHIVATELATSEMLSRDKDLLLDTLHANGLEFASFDVSHGATDHDESETSTGDNRLLGELGSNENDPQPNRINHYSNDNQGSVINLMA